jgi:hypothetical protein
MFCKVLAAALKHLYKKYSIQNFENDLALGVD